MFVGLVNGVAGGILRDVLVEDVPRFFRGQLSALILIFALFIYVVMLVLQVNSDAAAWVAIILAAIARWLVIRFNLQTSPVNQWKIEQALAELPANLQPWKLGAVAQA